MELYAPDVQLSMTESHNLSLVTHCSHFETLRQPVPRNHPGVVAPDGDVASDTAEDGVVGDDVAWGCNTVKDIAQILEPATKHFSDGLMAEAHA